MIPGTMNNMGSQIGTIADLSEILAEVEVDETEISLSRTRAASDRSSRRPGRRRVRRRGRRDR